MSQKVIHLVLSLAHGGLEKLVVQWSNLRNERDPGSTRICCIDAVGDLAVELNGKVDCLFAKRGRFPWDREAVQKLRDLFETFGCDVVHSHNLAAQQYAAIAAGSTRVRHVYTQHGANLHNFGLKDRLRSAWLARGTDALVAVSESAADPLRKNPLIAAERVRLIENGIPLPEPPAAGEVAAVRRSLSLPGEARLIGSVGRLSRVKGYDRLLRAVADVDVHVVLVGDGPERANLERLAESLGIEGRVHLVGAQADPLPYVMLMDWFVLTSRSEGLSVALLEALGLGRATIVTDVGANRRVIDGDRFGIVLPDHEEEWPQIFAAAIESPDRDPERIAAARERVGGRFDAAQTLEQYEAVYCGAE